MIADAAADQDGIPGPGEVAGDVDAIRHHADAGGGDEAAVALAALDHLGVAGDHLHAGARAAKPMLATMRSRSDSGRPSSRMKPAVR
jgi:hypothetical protein